MGQDLLVQPFSAALLRDVQGFSCGEEPWQVEVAQWITGESEDNALKRMAEGTEVWLYRNENHDVVGYGSLGKTAWSWPPPKGPKEVVSIVPYLGVQERFQSEPKGLPRNARYGYRILLDLIAKATGHGTRVLGLFVDESNTRAIAFYERAGFMNLAAGGKKYRRMYLYLRDPPRVGPPTLNVEAAP